MNEHVQREFHTDGPIELRVEIGSGSVVVTATETTRTHVEVEGRGAEEVTIEQSGNVVSVIGPKNRSIMGRDRSLHVRVSLPTDSVVATKLGSADLDVSGRLAACELKSGSGDIRLDDVAGEAFLLVGSGDVTITGQAATLDVKSGSGQVEVEAVTGATQVVTGSGDVRIGSTGEAVNIKTGSGDTVLGNASGAIAVTTASGDLAIGRMPQGELRAKAASGDIKVGIPAGTPVWTDINTITGTAHARLESAGPPQDGQDHVVVRATTVSGDVLLHQA